jgi:hypothetical protein
LFEKVDMKANGAHGFYAGERCQLYGFLLKDTPSSRLGSYLMAKKALKRAWTPADLKTLKSLARQKTHAGRIAKTLKRSEGATRQKAFSMGLSLDSR